MQKTTIHFFAEFSYTNASIFSFLAFNLRRYSLSTIADSVRVNIFVPNKKILIRMGGLEIRHVLGNKNIGGSV
jgi:hypothetical protein